MQSSSVQSSITRSELDRIGLPTRLGLLQLSSLNRVNECRSSTARHEQPRRPSPCMLEVLLCYVLVIDDNRRDIETAESVVSINALEQG
ncbi:hypothetical protein PHSY_006004 [Pseudozyma hubeiensis SY62]|uniref:Uncharacterized protein n=1 Tax=Pseudozyma hubeiensis (strain SY62) TaxID=1305764 RepID=R9PJZ0_PSEHS|nr:hypothetical protein PHSY_006004 [Pseudozyma hubeiensis SY62]GAC98410.1 hypothetical protein PHSY_006004 [Pseudozyma hubeiensis SY62]